MLDGSSPWATFSFLLHLDHGDTIFRELYMLKSPGEGHHSYAQLPKGQSEAEGQTLARDGP